MSNILPVLRGRNKTLNMATCSAVENILDTLKDHSISCFVEEMVLEGLAESIAKNLCIEHQSFPKWD